MLSFFKKKDGGKPVLEGEESVVSSSELLSEEQQGEQSSEEIITALSLHPDWNITKEDQYAFQFLNMECPPLKPNQLSLSGISLIEETENNFRITAFIRSSVNRPIELKETTLVLLNEKGDILGRKLFDLQEVGEIPAQSSRPWNFYFTNKDLFTTELPAQGWKLAFQLQPSSRKHTLDLAKSWKKSLASSEKKKLQELVEGLEPPKKGEVNFMGLQAKIQENGDLHASLLIRNGSDKQVKLEQIPLQIEDASGEVIASGGFKLEDFTVSANTSKPWTFIFPASLVTKKEPDFSSWRAYPPENAKTSN